MIPKEFLSEFQYIDLPMYGVKLPTFQIPIDAKLGLDEKADNYEFLRRSCFVGFQQLNLEKGSEIYKEYVNRTRYELETIKDLGFVDYILLVWDVVNYCKENKIPVGLGRGSAAGSLVLFLIGVTQINPIPYGLYFERFISKIRAKKKIVDNVVYLDGKLMCDIDIDICYYNRPKVLAYLKEKFQGRVSNILTVNTLSGKLLIKECGKIVGAKSEQEMNLVSDMIPKLYGNVRDIQTSYNGEKNEKGEWKTPPVSDFVKWCDENKEVYEVALKLRNLIKNKGVHASGILLSCDPLEESCPQELSSDKLPVSAFTMDWASLTNIKLDILGLRAVSVIDDVCKTLNIDIKTIDVNDPFIYAQYPNLKASHGLFQIEAETNLRVCQKVKPRNLEELSGVLALARPGALAFVDDYAAFVNEGKTTSIHPFFDNVLNTTGGVVIYQEQLMKLANKIGFTLDEAEIIRRIVGKKKREEMVAWEQKVRDKVAEHKLDPALSDIFWKILDANKDYSFNKSHSMAYAALAAVTTYLKFKYPSQFFLSLLKMSRNEPSPIEEISKIQKELASFNIKLLPPHIIKSEMDFSIEGNDIRFGLLSIKGVAEKSIEKLQKFRSPRANKFEVFRGAEEAGLSFGILCALIQAGALEGCAQERPWVVLEAQLWKLLTEREKKLCLELGEKFDYNIPAILKFLQTFTDEKGKPVLKPSRYNTIKRNAQGYIEIYNQNKRNQKFANWFYERELLGYSYSYGLKDVFGEQFPHLVSIREAHEELVGKKIGFAGIITETMRGTAKSAKKTKYYKIKVRDESGEITVLLFNDAIGHCEVLNKTLPAEDNIVIVDGFKKEDAVFANKIVIQDYKIYMKLSALKEAQSKKKP